MQMLVGEQTDTKIIIRCAFISHSLTEVEFQEYLSDADYEASEFGVDSGLLLESRGNGFA